MVVTGDRFPVVQPRTGNESGNDENNTTTTHMPLPTGVPVYRRHPRLLAPIRTLTVGPGISPDQPHDCS